MLNQILDYLIVRTKIIRRIVTNILCSKLKKYVQILSLNLLFFLVIGAVIIAKLLHLPD